jgi:hypothetical protein
MKKIILFVAIVMSLQATAQTKKVTTKTIEVNGNCGMCKKSIEKAAVTAGAKTAKWDETTHKLTVKFSEAKTTVQKIKDKIAEVGYDSEGTSATDAAYNKLHGCCKYDRKAIPVVNQ